MKIDLGLIIEHKPWRLEPFAKKKVISHIIAETIKAISAFKNIKNIEIAVLLTNDEKMQELNGEFRDKNKPTNVLSFPDIEIKPQDLLEFLHAKEYIYVGDIAVGYDIIKQEAMDAGISMHAHFTHLVVHGVLHLIGYDHMNDNDAEEMMNLEVQILKELGVKSPY
jgi:probable rRNA maturation factor